MKEWSNSRPSIEDYVVQIDGTIGSETASKPHTNSKSSNLKSSLSKKKRSSIDKSKSSNTFKSQRAARAQILSDEVSVEQKLTGQLYEEAR